MSGGSEGSSISENKKYFKAVKNILDRDDEILKTFIVSLGYYPAYVTGWYVSKLYTDSLDNLSALNIPYYVIDFNSTDCIVAGIYKIIVNDYPYNNLIKGVNVPEEAKPEVEAMVIEIKAIFEEYFVEITKEEWLEIHNQCIAGTWVPEWE